MNSPFGLKPIYERRPPEVVQAIESQFETLTEQFPDGYTNHGTSDYYEFLPAISTTSLVSAMHRQKGSLRVLDVGAGAGAFISRSDWKLDDIVHGISAYDYRKEKLARSTGLLSRGMNRYIIGDVERLDEIPEVLPEYDLVVTRWLLHHTIDTLGTFEQIANKVGEGGLLAFDGFGWKNQDGNHAIPVEVVTDSLDAAGFVINTDEDPLSKKLLQDLSGFSTMPSMVIRRETSLKPVCIPATPFMDDNLPKPSTYYRASYNPLEV